MALNIDGVIPVEVKQIDSIKIMQTIINSENNTILLVYKKLSGEDVVGSGQITIEGENYTTLVGGNITVYMAVKESLYNYMKSELGITGVIV